jgi:iron complex outermembrane receptor protein
VPGRGIGLSLGLSAGLLFSGVAIAQNGDATSSQTLAPIQVEGESQVETATGPVEGYVAERARSATKTDTPLIETPQSVSVISAQQIQDQQARDLRSVLRYVGGAVPELRGNVASRYDQIKLRGFDPDQYLDGLRLPTYYYSLPKVDPYLLERVEVIKGPASVLYGRTPPGGVINLVSKRPTEDQVNEVYLEGGNDSRAEMGFDIGGQLDEDGNALYRVVATGSQRNGPQETVQTKNFSIAPSLRLRLSEVTELTLLAKYRSDPEAGSYGALPYQGTVDPLANGSKLPRDFYDGDNSFENFDRKQTMLGYEFSHWFNDDLQFRQNFRFDDSEIDYRSVYGTGLIDQDTLGRGTAASRENMQSLAVDNQLLGYVDTGPVSHTLLIGFDHQNTDADRATGFGPAPPLQLVGGDHSQTIVDPDRTRYDFDQDQTGFYAQDQAKIGRLTMLAGGRYDSIQTSQTTSFGASRDTRTDRAFSGRLGALYNFDNGIAPYVAYTESFQAPSINGVSAEVLEPTEGEQYEIGLKYQPPGSNALFTASAFQITQTNVNGPTLPDGTVSQTGEVEVQGVEFEAKASLMRGLDLSAAATWLDSEITRDETGNQGNELQQTPDYTASLWLAYTQPAGPWKGLGGGAGVRYIGEQQITNANELQVPDYTVADASIHYELGGLKPAWDGWRVGLNMQNVFDKKYVSSCTTQNFCYFGYGRETTATVSYRWE